MKRKVFKLCLLLFMIVVYKDVVFAQGIVEMKAEKDETGAIMLDVTVDEKTVLDEMDATLGVHIYRSESETGAYQLIKTVSLEEFYYDWDCVYSYHYKDTMNLVGYTTYFYRVDLFKSTGVEQIVLSTHAVNVNYVPVGPRITYAKRSGKRNAKLVWEKQDNIDGYCIYGIKDFTDKGKYVYKSPYDFSNYKLLKTIEDPNTVSCTFKKLVHGVTYTYLVFSYKMINGEQVLSEPNYFKSVPMDYYAYASESYNRKVKRAFGSYKAKNKNFKSANKARKQMTTIKIKVWDFKNGKKGKKITKVKSLTVNKRLAPTIKQIFKEIYNSKEKQVIHDIGCYSYRPGEHMYGTAIDVNANENYMISDGKILAGSYWRPKKDPYSIPNNSDFVRIMNRYGFYRGSWGNRKDYMHFSFFGT